LNGLPWFGVDINKTNDLCTGYLDIFIISFTFFAYFV